MQKKTSVEEGEAVGGHYCSTFTCRGCTATRTEYQRKGVPTAQEEEKPSTLFSILQAAVISIMMAALLVRCATFINSQPTVPEMTLPDTMSDYGLDITPLHRDNGNHGSH